MTGHAPPDATLGLVVEDPDDDGVRADVVLGRRIEGLSRRVARQRGLAGGLTIDGRRAAPSQRVRLGSEVRLRVDVAARQAAPTVDVLAVTDDYVYVDKPPGLHTVRLRPDDPPTLADAVATLHPECAAAAASPADGGAVHRLDHGTSGVVCFARNAAAWTRARDAFSDGTVHKTYVAAIHGSLPAVVPLVSAGSVRRIRHAGPSLVGIVEGTLGATGLCIDAPLGPQSGAAGQRRVRLSDHGRDAITEVWPVSPVDAEAPRGPVALVVLALRTGHRHQARVHLAALGCPIVGDPLYATASDEPQAPPTNPPVRLCLHAAALQLAGTVTGQPRVVSPVPAQFATS